MQGLEVVLKLGRAALRKLVVVFGKDDSWTGWSEGGQRTTDEDAQIACAVHLVRVVEPLIFFMVQTTRHHPYAL